MEGVGARLGRSSSRYGTTTVFTGPVRKWKKDWIFITPPSSSNNNTNTNTNTTHNTNSNNHHLNSSNGTSLNGNNVSHLRLFKWTPVNSNKDRNNNSIVNGDTTPTKDDTLSEEPPRRKFKYIPIAVLEDQKKETEDDSDDEAKPVDTDENSADQTSKSDGHDEKPDINDMPMEENEETVENQPAPGRQDLNESLDLSLGLTSHEDDNEQERLNSGAGKA